MKSDLYFLQFNNYYNRKLKYLPNITDYEDYIELVVNNSAFKPNDYIYTTIEGVKAYDDNGFRADYMLQVQIDSQNRPVIVSRWFVIDAIKIGDAKYDVNLFRDTLADYYNEIQNAPIFVEKAMLDANNPLIFNQEDMTFNQIRQQPRLLNDITECPWIVGYVPKDAEFNGIVSTTYNITGNPDITVESIDDWGLSDYLSNQYVLNSIYTKYRYNEMQRRQWGGFQNSYDCTNYEYTVGKHKVGVNPLTATKTAINTWQGWLDENSPATGNYNNDTFTGTYYYIDVSAPPNDYYSNVANDTTYNTYLTGLLENKYSQLTDVQFQELNDLNDQILYESSTGIYYRLKVNLEVFTEAFSIANEQAMVSKLREFIGTPAGGSTVPNTFTISVEGYKAWITLEQVNAELKIDFGSDGTNRYHLEDEAFDMFCIPYGDIYVFEADVGFRTNKIGPAIATELCAKVGSDKIYDIQLLPYCPVQYAWDDEYHSLDLTKTSYKLITDENDKKISVLIWCRKSNFNFNIECYIPNVGVALEKKIRSQTRLYRLSSPNGNGIFEFNPYKNDGLDFLRVDCTYKPFNPYIRVAPVFKELYGYGGQYDYRGLILGGDFSLTQMSNAWVDYQLRNKNYQATFDRQIDHLEVQNKYQRINEIFGAVTGSGTAAVSGALTGSMIGTSGGPYGAIAGAAVGAAVGVASGVADIVISEKLRNEAIDYTKDQFGYQLGNIQALPTSLSKTTALNINNPLVPMLEIFMCTPTEEDAFRNKIKYNGMTVMAIGTMSQYSEGYFKGKLIRLEGISDDYHIINTIASELNKGVYLS